MREAVFFRTPVYRRLLFDNAVQVTVYGAVRNWNYAGTTPQEIQSGNPGIITDLAAVIGALRVRRALVPKPAFNARVVRVSDLTNEILPSFFRGADADGVIVEQSGDAYFLASADCLTGVIYDPRSHRLAALHCGRNALIDRIALDGKPARTHSSVVFAGLQKLDVLPQHVSALQVFLAAGIGPDGFAHLTTQTMLDGNGQVVQNPYADSNRRLIQHLLDRYEWRSIDPSPYRRPVVTDPQTGKIDLVGLVEAQLSQREVPLSHILWDGHDTATDVDANGNFLFHSNRRDHKLRNLIVVQLM